VTGQVAVMLVNWTAKSAATAALAMAMRKILALGLPRRVRHDWCPLGDPRGNVKKAWGVTSMARFDLALVDPDIEPFVRKSADGSWYSSKGNMVWTEQTSDQAQAEAILSHELAAVFSEAAPALNPENFVLT
jgi:hypothetical protein